MVLIWSPFRWPWRPAILFLPYVVDGGGFYLSTEPSVATIGAAIPPEYRQDMVQLQLGAMVSSLLGLITVIIFSTDHNTEGADLSGTDTGQLFHHHVGISTGLLFQRHVGISTHL